MEEKITKETMQQYENVRRSGLTNMFDFYTVIRIAKAYKFNELSKLTLDDYKNLLMNFGTLMKTHDIKQN